MANPEARANAALKRLGEEFRLGMIPAAEYHAKRRQIFEGWAERDITTSPGVTQRNRSQAPEPAAVPPTTRPKWVPIVVGIVAALVLAGVAAALMVLKAPQPPATTAAPASPAVAAAKAAAESMVEEKRWDAERLESFIARWRSLSREERQLAWREPAIRSLRHELQQTILALEAVTPAEGSPERAQLQELVDFVGELDQDAP